MALYHYESREAGEAIERSGLRIARRGERFALHERPGIGDSNAAHPMPVSDAVGW
jgi:hypothetical protein